jgi:hypothetical protein
MTMGERGRLAQPVFLLHDAEPFGRLRAALTACRRAGSFAPGREAFAALLPAAEQYAARAHLGPDALLLPRAADGLGFDRDRWRTLVGELLWLAAADWPLFPVSPPALERLLGPGIRPALLGSRELVLGTPFRPGMVGWSDPGEVAGLARWLTAADSAGWRPADLAGLPGLEGEDAEGLDEELEVVRQSLADLTAMYSSAAAVGRVVVVEAD